MILRRFALLCLLLAIQPDLRAAASGSAGTGGGKVENDPPPLAAATLEQLVNLEITTVSRKEQKLANAPAAVFVLTQEDIRRSGALTIPDALRMVPGLHVAQISSSQWAISARGFNGRFANKMLVMVDGRTVYNPLFSGVYWESVADTLLEDVERIEVVRGPGATMWGANAVNGVIHIITKHTRDTQGSFVATGAGPEGLAFSHFRHGGNAGRRGTYRVFGKYDRHPDSPSGHGFAEARDSWRNARAGFRADWSLSEAVYLSVQAGGYSTSARDSILVPVPAPPYVRNTSASADADGGFLLGRFDFAHGESASTSFQTFFERGARDEGLGSGHIESLDFELQHRRSLARHDLIVGLGYRRLSEPFGDSPHIHVEMAVPGLTHGLANVFLQDDITLRTDLHLIAGVKLEHNYFTGLETQPSIQALWTPSRKQTVWGSISRAVRTPSRAENDLTVHKLFFPTGTPLPGLLLVQGSGSYRSESLQAHEIGYRVQPFRSLALDLSVFHNSYSRLRSVDLLPTRVELLPGAGPVAVLPSVFSNSLRGHTSGFEASVQWSARPNWRLVGGYSSLCSELQFTGSGPSPATLGLPSVLPDPAHRFQLRSLYDLTRKLELDAALYAVSSVPGYAIPAYFRPDLRLGWRISPAFELSVKAENFLNRRHYEYLDEGWGASSRFGRRSYAALLWHF
jgi:iron complex outermembrane receptor protein